MISEVLAPLRRSPRFARLWIAEVVSLGGDWFTIIALAVLVSHRAGGSGLAVNALLATQMLPMVLLGPRAGVLVDRFDRRGLMIAADGARCGLALLFIPVAAAGHVAILFVLAFVHFSMSSLFEPARAALLPRLVARDELIGAATLSSVTWSVMAAVGAILGGTLVAVVGIPGAFAIDAATFAASALLVASIGSPGPLPRGGATVGPALRDAVRHLAHHPATAAAVLVKSIAGVAVVDGFVVLYATRELSTGLGGPGAALGVLWGSFGVGALVGPILLGEANDGTPRRMRRLIAVGSAFICGGLALLAVAPTLGVAALALALRGAGGAANWTFSTAILQKTVPDELLGRVFALDNACLYLAALASSLCWGFLVDAKGLRPAAESAAAVAFLLLCLWLAAVRCLEGRERTQSRSG